MPVVGRLKIKGSPEALKMLTELGPKLARKHLRPALRAGAKIIRTEAQERAPVRTGALKKSIKVRAGKAKKKWSAVVLVQTRDGDFAGEEFYGAIIHEGTVERVQKTTGRRVGKVEPMPYMRDAFDAKKDEAEDAIAKRLEESILSER